MNPERGIWCGPETIPVAEVKALASRVEELGYSMMWVNEVFGRDPFALCAALGDATSQLVLATGIANVYNRHAGSMKQGANTVAELTDGRFVLGLGVSSPQLVERGEASPTRGHCPIFAPTSTPTKRRGTSRCRRPIPSRSCWLRSGRGCSSSPPTTKAR